MASVDVIGNLLLVLPANFGGGGSVVGCVGFFIYLFFF